MPFYIMPVDWSAPGVGTAYTQTELDQRIMSHVEAMNLVPGTLEYAILNQMEFIELDRLFNNAPN